MTGWVVIIKLPKKTVLIHTLISSQAQSLMLEIEHRLRQFLTVTLGV